MGRNASGPRSPTAAARPRELRRRQTPAETLLWAALRRRQVAGHYFRRQHPVGAYIADFCCTRARLIVEVDGPSHDLTSAADRRRTAYLEAVGYTVVRIANDDVRRHLEGVVALIRDVLAARTGGSRRPWPAPPPRPSP